MTTVDDGLQELELKLGRLKIEYEQYFLGGLKREPQFLRGEIQRLIQQYLQRPPTNARQKFRFSSICSRYQSYRQLWERTLRQIDDGSYQKHIFQAELRERERRGSGEPFAPPEPVNGKSAGSHIERLYRAFAAVRKKTGEGMGDLTPSKLAALVKKQTAELRRTHGKGTLRFRVVVEEGRARLRATFVRS